MNKTACLMLAVGPMLPGVVEVPNGCYYKGGGATSAQIVTNWVDLPKTLAPPTNGHEAARPLEDAPLDHYIDGWGLQGAIVDFVLVHHGYGVKWSVGNVVRRPDDPSKEMALFYAWNGDECVAIVAPLERRQEPQADPPDGWIDFDGKNCEGPCRGWDGVSRRCDCGNRRVYWCTDEDVGRYAVAD